MAIMRRDKRRRNRKMGCTNWHKIGVTEELSTLIKHWLKQSCEWSRRSVILSQDHHLNPLASKITDIETQALRTQPARPGSQAAGQVRSGKTCRPWPMNRNTGSSCSRQCRCAVVDSIASLMQQEYAAGGLSREPRRSQPPCLTVRIS